MAEVMQIGARNPRAVTEAVLGRPIDWTTVSDERQLIGDVLATPYDELFDPAFESPLYLGLEVDDKARTVLAEPRFLKALSKAVEPPRDDELDAAVDLAEVRVASDLKSLVGVSLQDVPVRSVTPSATGGWTVELGKATSTRRADLATKLSSAILESLWSKTIIDTGWTPAGAEWADVGSFFREAAEYFDPVQAGLADCWLVSALSSVAWAMPFGIVQRTRATGTADQSFVNLVELTEPSNSQVSRYEMTDQTLVWSGTTTPRYSRSSENGELWPQIIEKAYANFRAGTNQDHPDLTALNYGDCVHASAVLTGRKPHYTGTATSTTTDLTNLVKAHSVDHRTVNPMTCWTYGTSAGSPDNAAYSSANIVANHCYSVLGWIRGSQILRPRLTDEVDLVARHSLLAAGASNALLSPHVSVHDAVTTLDPAVIQPLLSQDYIVLRNPWGYVESTSGELSGVIKMKDVSFWRSIDLDVDDGVFAIDFATFKKYFAGIGVAL